MKKYLEILLRSPLFRGIAPEELEQLIPCLGGGARRYSAGAAILLAGTPAGQMGLVLSGRVRVVREEFSGSRALLAELEPGELFAETFACAPALPGGLPVTVLAAEDCAVLLMDLRKVVQTCPNGCPFHTRLVSNLLGVLAWKNLALNRRMVHLSRRSTRGKLLSYLSEQAAMAGGNEFTIPFGRQELADYLCVERSAMSAVLSRLRDEGVLETHRNHFRLLRLPEEEL